MTEINDKQALNPEDVAAFLKQNPEFFAEHEYLLNDLKLPHANGSAISLGERQVQVFREHRDQLRTQLNELIAAAQENDKHFETSKRLLLDMLDVKTLDEIELVLQAAFKDDANIFAARLALFGNPDEFPASELSIHSETVAREELGTLMDSQKAVCGRFTDRQLQFLFQNDAENVGSAAIIPIRNGKSYGMLCLASADELHFDSSMGSLFLSYISDFVARLLPQLLLRARTKSHAEKVPSLLD